MPNLTPVVFVALSFLLACGASHPTICDAPVAYSSSTCTCGACPAQFHAYVYAAENSGQMSTFPIEAGTGVFGSPITSAGPAGSLGMAVMPIEFLFASNPQSGSGGAVNVWTIDSETGALTPVPGSPFSVGGVTQPAGLAIVENLNSGPFLYVADAGKIDALQLVTNGSVTLTAVPGSPFSSGTNLYLTADVANDFIFAADEDPPGGVLAFGINPQNGALAAVPGSPFPIASNSSSNPKFGQIVVDPSDSFVYVAMTSTNQIAGFSITPSTGALTPVPGSPFTAGSGVFAITPVSNTLGSSNFLYVSNRTDGTVSGYSIDPTTGVLSPLEGSPFPIAADTLVADTLGHLYASGPSGMMLFSINLNTGALTQSGSPIAFAGATSLVYVGP